MYDVSMTRAGTVGPLPETLTDEERARLARVDTMREYFTDEELARLAFIRWLVTSGKVAR